ncbi:MAG TPA: hypothetical protein VGP68_18415 [Gemmataceae bacterium]|jgi:hypothetical protein|nr:hypothetical protein [Gemmataceae bacterium]
MAVSSRIQAIFGYFENLNLLILMEDLRNRQTARQGWSTGRLLCPIAHGLPTGDQVRELNMLGQTADLSQGCDYAARHLGANPAAVMRFVCSWDDATLSQDWLLFQLEELWYERLENAEAVQEMLESGSSECIAGLVDDGAPCFLR